MSKRRLLSGHEVEEPSEEWLARMEQDFKMYRKGIVRILPQGYIYAKYAPVILDKIQSFQFRPDDVVVMTYPKCGTTWMQEIIWTMFNNHNLDNPEASEQLYNRSYEISLDMKFDSTSFYQWKGKSIHERFHQLCPGKRVEDGVFLQLLEVQSGRRVIKCHYPLELLPPDLLNKTKVVYVARNPKDVIVSFHHFVKVTTFFEYQGGSLEKFTRQFMNGDIFFGPYWPHVKQAWEKRSEPNLHFVFYEHMKEDIMTQLHQLNTFLDTNLTQQQLQHILQHTSFSSMKTKVKFFKDEGLINGEFYRKGVAGDWMNCFSPELNKEVDQWIKNNTVDSDITYKWN